MALTKEEIAEILKKAREEKKLTQAEVAEKSKVSTNYYAAVERGKENISTGKLNRICETLNIKIKFTIS